VNENSGEYSLGDGEKYQNKSKMTHAPTPKPTDDLKYIREVCGKFARPTQANELADPIANLNVRLKTIEAFLTTPPPTETPTDENPGRGASASSLSPTSMSMPTLRDCVGVRLCLLVSVGVLCFLVSSNGLYP
jgi:hypothetical protein